MKDSIVRGRVLQLLCERREEGLLLFGAAAGAIPPPAGVDNRAWLHALAELADHGFVRWQSHLSQRGAMVGHAEITEKGLDVCEGRASPELRIRLSC